MPGFSGSNVTPKPAANKVLRGSVTLTSAYQTVGNCKRVIPKGKRFQITKIVVSCPEDYYAKITFGGADESVEYCQMGKSVLTDWYPCGDKVFVGDGTKELNIQAKYVTTAATLWAEIVGVEEEA